MKRLSRPGLCAAKQCIQILTVWFPWAFSSSVEQSLWKSVKPADWSCQSTTTLGLPLPIELNQTFTSAAWNALLTIHCLSMMSPIFEPGLGGGGNNAFKPPCVPCFHLWLFRQFSERKPENIDQTFSGNQNFCVPANFSNSFNSLRTVTVLMSSLWCTHSISNLWMKTLHAYKQHKRGIAGVNRHMDIQSSYISSSRWKQGVIIQFLLVPRKWLNPLNAQLNPVCKSQLTKLFCGGI
jgi:hypothetical protein